MKKYKGFTLIELMIFVAIASIIIAILFPVFFISENTCTIHTPTQTYSYVEKSSMEFSESELFFISFKGREVSLSKYNAEISCN